MRIGRYWIMKPYEAFGNRAEDLFFALLKCRRENLQLLIVKRKWNLFGRFKFRHANRQLLNIEHPLIHKGALLEVFNYILTLFLSFSRFFGVGGRKLMSVLHIGSGKNILVALSELEFGRDSLWGRIDLPYVTKNNKIDWGSEFSKKLNVTYGTRDCLWQVFPELRNGKYVCLHVRTGGFFNDEYFSAPRNAKIEHYILAIKELVRRGYKVVRLGDCSMPALEVNGVLDYAHHPARSEVNDVLLVEHCDFYIGSQTGPIDLACLFEKRILLVNCLSLSHGFWYRTGSRFIPKKAMINNKVLSLKEQIDLHLFELTGTGRMDCSVTWVENSPEEILAAVEDFLDEVPLTARQAEFNHYLAGQICDYFNSTAVWDRHEVDVMQKTRWLSRFYSVKGGISLQYLNSNWD